MKIVRPDTRHLRRELAQAARSIAERLAAAGHRTWIVGGAVRDLALGRRVQEVDLCTSALPDEIEACFDQTIGVGKAFGTVIVVFEGLNIEVTTFRSERGYSDGRHPDEVTFGATPEEDAKRRDFTLNALFLDPLTMELLDPEGGMEDLESGVLRAIGDADERFGEDALRLLRLARFHARIDLAIDPDTQAAARRQASAIANVSPERIYAELAKILVAPRAHVALRLLDELTILERALPGWAALFGPHLTTESARVRRFEALDWLESSHALSGFAVLFDPLGGDHDAARACFAHLKPSKADLKEVTALWACLDRMEALWPLEESRPERGPDRSARLRILGDAVWPRARDLAAAFGDARGPGRMEAGEWVEFEDGHLGRMGRELVSFQHELPEGALQPAPLLQAQDLLAQGLPAGPELGRLLGDAFELQLQGVLKERAAALAWVAEQRGAS